MEDEYEGAFSEATFEGVITLGEGEEAETLERELNEYERSNMNLVRDLTRRGAFVNCWHMNEDESAAMWKVYSGLGIAIQSTFQRLAKSFVDRYEPVYISTINYEDFMHIPMRFDSENRIESTLYKRKMFEYERELRAFWLHEPMTDGKITLMLENHPVGQSLNVDLRTLIEQVYISPGRRDWFQGLVRNVLDKYGFTRIPVVPSALDDVPHTQTWKDAVPTE
jgi:hypothetical protein